MIRVEEVRARIEAMVPDLAGRLEGAARFGDLVARNAMPQQTPAGFVLPGSIQGGAARAMAGAFVQDMDDGVTVVLAVRTVNDATGNAAFDEVTPLVRQVILAVLGWSPDDCPGVFVLRLGELVGSQGGVLVYEITFSISDQIRIIA